MNCINMGFCSRYLLLVLMPLFLVHGAHGQAFHDPRTPSESSNVVASFASSRRRTPAAAIELDAQKISDPVSWAARDSASTEVMLGRRRALLPVGTVIKDKSLQMHSHVVRITSQSNGAGTGLLLKTDFVLTSKRVVENFMDPAEFTIDLGFLRARGLNVSLHPVEDLAVIKIHPPMDGTGRYPEPNSPKGLFWPIAKLDPKVGSLVTLYGYGGCFSYGSENFLSYHSFPVSEISKKHIVIRTGTTIATTSGDSGGPGFNSNNNSVLAAVVTNSKPREAVLVSGTSYRDWIFDAIQSSCTWGGEDGFAKLAVGNDPDTLMFYHCVVERAERLGVHLYSKAGCSNAWKAIQITDEHGRAIATVQTDKGRSRSNAKLSKEKFGSAKQFYISFWKTKFLVVHTKLSRYGPFSISKYMDGGIHFEWCAN